MKKTKLDQMKVVLLKKTFLIIAVFGLLSLVFTSCSSNDDDTEIPSLDKNTYKITVTLNNVNSDDDFVSVAVAGGAAGNDTTIWKLNGTEQPGEQAIGLGANDFTGATKTYVLETVNPILGISCGVQIINYGADLPYALKIEKNGNVEVNTNGTLSGDGSDFTKNYSF